MADRIAHQTVVLEGALQVRHPILGFVWYTRRFSLCADCVFRRYNGDQLRYLQFISSRTTVNKEDETDFVICVNPPGSIAFEHRFHIRAETAAERDRWADAISQMIASETHKETTIQSKFGQPGLTFLEEANIISHPNGARHTLDDLRGHDIVGIYLSAKWCGPCQAFTQQLSQLYKELVRADHRFGVLFVSNNDFDEKSFTEYFHQMPWVALDYNDDLIKVILAYANRTLNVRSIPTLILIDPKTGATDALGFKHILSAASVLTICAGKSTTQGVEIIKAGADAFPWRW